jgi:hypothetical protein
MRVHNHVGVWSLETVRTFWREHHTHVQSPVRCGMITRMSGQSVFVAVGERHLGVINLYGLDLKLSDDVYIHQQVVVEKK